ncbi:unnamed protein product [Calicophoron daubneyi]|uniref:WD repeat-containing protein 37 n=1 Tax=Calicophoron daubneyi TaxID=300641 RepID=A0AAV2TRQ7_CALDB
MSVSLRDSVVPDQEVMSDPINSPVTLINPNPCSVGGNPSIASDSAEKLAWHLLGEYTGPVESLLPREFRQRLHKHFARIEREFEREYRRLYGENLALQERLEKFEDGDHSESTTLAKKLGASMLSQRIKQQYKQSTSRLVSTLRQSTGHSSSGAPNAAATSSVQPGTVAAASVNTATGISPATALSTTHGAVPFSPVGTMSATPGTQGLAVFGGTFTSHAGSWQLLNRLTAHRDGIWEVNTHRRFVATASADSTVKLWTNDNQMGCLMVYLGHSGSVNSVRFRDRDHLLLTSSGDGTAHLIRLPYDLLVKAAVALNTNPSAASFALEAASASLMAAVAGSASMGMGIGSGVNAKAGPCPRIETDEAGSANELDVLDDGSPVRTATAVNTAAPIYIRHPHAIFESANLSLSTTGGVGGGANGASTMGTYIDSAPLSAADFLTGREQLVTAGWDRVGRIYDLVTGQELDSLTGHDHQLTDVRCAPDGSPVVVTSSRDCTFRLWDFRQPGMRVHIQQAHNQTVSTTQFLAGGPTERLISAGADRFCRLWDLRQSRGPVVTIRTDAGINRLAMSGSGSLAALSLVGGDSSGPGISTVASNVPVSTEGSLPPLPAGVGTQTLGSVTGNTNTSGPGAQTTSSGAHPPASSSWATSYTKILALPLDNRGIKFFDLNGTRIGRLTRSSTRGHARMVTSVAWAEEGSCNFFSTGFDCRLLAWQIQLTPT